MTKQNKKQTKKPTKKPNDFHNAIFWLVIIGLFCVIFGYYVQTSSNKNQLEQHIEKMNLICEDIETLALDINGNYTLCMDMYNNTDRCAQSYDDVDCYYAQLETNDYLMDNTEPLCVCDITINGTMFTFSYRTPR